MPSAPVLRLTVLVLPREQVSTYSSFFRASNEQQHRAEPAKPRTLLLVIKDPENVSLGQLANLIKDLWVELWPAEGPLQIKRLLDDAYPEAAFSIHCSVADIWVDNGRREREGFDQLGTVRVIQVPSSSTPSPAHRYQRAPSVCQDIEGAAREAKRKYLDSAVSANGSLTRSRDTATETRAQNKEQPGPQERPTKRPRLTEEAEPVSPTPAGSPHSTTSFPVFYNDGRVPSYAHPRGHRRHLGNNSTGSPLVGLGLGITASPAKARISTFNADVTAEGSPDPAVGPGPRSMPPPPRPRYSLRGPTTSSPLESGSEEDSPLAGKKVARRPFHSVPRETSRSEGPRTRAAKKTEGSGKKSERVAPSSDPVGTLKLTRSQLDLLEKDKRELQEVNDLLKQSRINPECRTIIQRMRHDLEERIKVRVAPSPHGEQRMLVFQRIRKKLRTCRNSLERFRRNGQLYEESDAHDTTSEDNGMDQNPGEGSDDESEEDMPRNRPRRSGIERRDLSTDFVVTGRVLSLRSHSKRAELENLQPSQKDKEPDGHDIQIVVEDTRIAQTSPQTSSSVAHDFLNGDRPEDGAASVEDESEDEATDSDGSDIEYESKGPKVEQSSPIRIPIVSQGASPRIAPPPRAENGENENGNDVIDPFAKKSEPSKTMLHAPTFEQSPKKQRPKGGLLAMFIDHKA